MHTMMDGSYFQMVIQPQASIVAHHLHLHFDSERIEMQIDAVISVIFLLFMSI